MPDLRPPIAAPFALFEVAATVTPVGGAAVATEVIGSAPYMVTREFNADPSIADYRRRVAVRKSDVPELPVGSTILAPEGFLAGASAKLYTVDETEDLDPEVWRAVVHD